MGDNHLSDHRSPRLESTVTSEVEDNHPSEHHSPTVDQDQCFGRRLPSPQTPIRSTVLSPMTPVSAPSFRRFESVSKQPPRSRRSCITCERTCESHETCSRYGRPLHATCAIQAECPLCLKPSSIACHQSSSRTHLMKQGAQMLRRTNRKFPPVNVGDTVAVPIPSPDRARETHATL